MRRNATANMNTLWYLEEEILSMDSYDMPSELKRKLSKLLMMLHKVLILWTVFMTQMTEGDMNDLSDILNIDRLKFKTDEDEEFGEQIWRKETSMSSQSLMILGMAHAHIFTPMKQPLNRSLLRNTSWKENSQQSGKWMWCI